MVQDKNKDIEKKEKEERKSKLSGFIPSDQIAAEMTRILQYYGTNLSSANDAETRKILSGASSLNDELVGMREEDM